jgi:predicted dehydrogenase
MKQVIRKGLKNIIVDEVADPVVTPHHVLIRPIYSLISSGTETADIHTENIMKEVADNPSHLRTVLNVLKQAGPLKTFNEVRAKMNDDYAVLGYSGAGVVVDKHQTITDLEIGQRVAYGGEGTGHGETILAGRNLVARVPDNVPFQHACFTTLGSIAMNAVRVAEIGVGETVAVIGLGLVGQLVSQLVRCQGGVVIAIDLQKERVELAKNTGADYPLIGSDATPESVLALTEGRGADCVIVAAASKSSVPVRQAIQMSRERGRIVIVGAVPLDLPRDQMYVKDLKLLMARAYGPGSYDPVYEKQGRDYPLPYIRWTENRNMEEFLRLMSVGRVDVGPLITHEYALEEAATAYETIMDATTNSLAVMLRYPAAIEEDVVASFKPKRKIETAIKTSKGNLNIALVGAGNLAKWEHLPNIKKLSGVELRAVYSASGARGKGYGLRFGAAYACSDYEEVLRDDEIDIVLIASRHQYHADQAIKALRAGKHVFIEKPLAITEDECREIYKAVQESGKQLTVGFNRRFAPFYLEQKRLLSRRTSPAIVTIRMNSPGLVGNFWAADPKYGGALVGEGCHFVDLMYWFLESEPVSVSAYSLPTGKQDPIGENNIVASFHFEDGSIGNLTYCTVGSKSSGGELIEFFTNGVAVSCEDFKKLTIKKATRSKSSKLFAEKGYLAQMQGFIESIRHGKEPSVTARDGARATIGCLRILESARTLMPCEINLDESLDV